MSGSIDGFSHVNVHLRWKRYIAEMRDGGRDLDTWHVLDLLPLRHRNPARLRPCGLSAHQSSAELQIGLPSSLHSHQHFIRTATTTFDGSHHG